MRLGRLFVGLVPRDGLLNLRRQVLNPHAQAVEAQLNEPCQVIMRGDPGIHFDGQFGTFDEMEMLPVLPHQVGELIRAEIGRGPPSPVHLDDIPPVRQQSRHLVDLPPDVLQVLLSHRHVGRDDHVAAAEETAMLAKRQVGIEAEGRLPIHGALASANLSR